MSLVQGVVLFSIAAGIVHAVDYCGCSFGFRTDVRNIRPLILLLRTLLGTLIAFVVVGLFLTLTAQGMARLTNP